MAVGIRHILKISYSPATAKILLSMKPDLSLRDQRRKTVLAYACFSPLASPEMIQLLLKNGANADESDERGVSLLWRVIHTQFYQASTVKALLDGGAKPDCMTFGLRAPIHLTLFSSGVQ
jgi:ankyrin repeat protein